MKPIAKCYICVYCQQCDKKQQEKCKSLNYILFTTDEQKKMCDLMCGRIEDDEKEY
jgi:hypothetical protein